MYNSNINKHIITNNTTHHSLGLQQERRTSSNHIANISSISNNNIRPCVQPTENGGNKITTNQFKLPYLSGVTDNIKHDAAGNHFNNINTNQSLKKATILDIQRKQSFFEDSLRRFAACDVKVQELLKILRADPVWPEIFRKLEVRVIKVKEKDKEIVLHPADEPKKKWSGKYHVYLTILNNNERLVVDPTVGGKNACAHVTESVFIGSNWQGTKDQDYIIETIAPADEFYDSRGVYSPDYSIDDYINYFFDPECYEKHKFYYNQ